MDLAKYPMDEQECTLLLESCESLRPPWLPTLLGGGQGTGTVRDRCG